MKVLLISPTFSGIGGIAQHVTSLKQYLENSGNQVDVLSSENSFTLPIKKLKNPSFMISSSLKVKFMKKYDIIHAHNIPSAQAMKNAKGKKILSLHGIFSEQINTLHGEKTGNFSKKYEQRALDWADAITVISKDAFDYYTNLGFHVFQIPNAINISSLPIKKDRRYKKQVIFAGRLSNEKGINSLIKIGKKLSSDIDLIVLGSGPEKNKIQELEKIQKNVHYFGYLNKIQTISLIRGSDALIQPSLKEGISSTILESMACETPVITTNVGGNLEIIEDHKTGFLVKPNTTSKILELIDFIFSNSSKIELITNNALKKVSYYDWKNVGSLYVKLYEKILN